MTEIEELKRLLRRKVDCGPRFGISKKVGIRILKLSVPWKHRPSIRTQGGRIQRKTWRMNPYAGVDYNLTLCPLQSRLQHIYHGQPYAWVDLNMMA